MSVDISAQGNSENPATDTLDATAFFRSHNDQGVFEDGTGNEPSCRSTPQAVRGRDLLQSLKRNETGDGMPRVSWWTNRRHSSRLLAGAQFKIVARRGLRIWTLEVRPILEA